MFYHERINDLFQLLLIHEYCSSLFLSDTLDVSARTIRSDIQLLNEKLSNNGAMIDLKRNYGYYINIQNKPLFHTFLHNSKNIKKNVTSLDTVEDRIHFILCELLFASSYYAMDELASMVYISKSTLNNYLPTIHQWIEPYGLLLTNVQKKGLRLEGSEENKRRFIVEKILSTNAIVCFDSFTKKQQIIFKEVDLSVVEDIIVKHLMQANIRLTDYNLKNLIVHFALMISRNKHNCTITTHQDFELEQDIERYLLELIKKFEQFFDIDINAYEFSYLYYHFVTNTNLKTTFSFDNNITEIIDKILDNVYEHYFIDLRQDEELFYNLFLHFRTILKCKDFRINKRNPLLDTIKKNFPFPYEITLTSVLPVFQQYNLSLTEDEIGYIALHIGATMEKELFHTSIANVILICGSGLSTTRMLEARIQAIFKDEIKIVKKISYMEFNNMKEKDFEYVDFVVSTVAIQSDYVATIVVNFALTQKDIGTINVYLKQLTAKKHTKLHTYFDDSLFIHHTKFKDKVDLLHELCKRLTLNNIVDDDFFSSILKRESIGDTSMSPLFALPHAFDHNAMQTKVAVALLDEPMEWNSNHTVQIVFLLAINKENIKETEVLYDNLVQLIHHPKLKKNLLDARDFVDFLYILEHYTIPS